MAALCSVSENMRGQLYEETLILYMCVAMLRHAEILVMDKKNYHIEEIKVFTCVIHMYVYDLCANLYRAVGVKGLCFWSGLSSLS